MKTFVLFSAFLLIVLFSQTGCEKSDAPVTDSIPVAPLSYFPLKIGNYWQSDFTHTGGGRVIKEVTGTKVINDKVYYSMKSSFTDGSRSSTDSSYYRMENDKVYIYSKISNTESVIFDLSVEENATWSYFGGPYIVTLKSKTDTITINGKKITNCYRFYYDKPQTADDEYTRWLAPGIGLIKSSADFGSTSLLTKAKIAGKEITF